MKGLVGEMTRDDLLRFLKKVDIDKSQKNGEACWNWNACKQPKGYGKFRFHGGLFQAHRWSYAVFCGDIEDGDTVDHICRNPSCVRPSHLRKMSHSENTALGNKDRVITVDNEEETPF